MQGFTLGVVSSCLSEGGPQPWGNLNELTTGGLYWKGY